MKKPTPDKLNIDFWNKRPDHPARRIVDKLLDTRSEWVVSSIDKYWWYELVNEELQPLFEKEQKAVEFWAKGQRLQRDLDER